MPFSEKTINDFIFTDGVKYESHVRYFADYISNIDEQKRVFSNGIWTDLVIESINQFIIEKGISSKARARHYRTGLRNYFNYLLEKGVIRNSEFKLELAEGNRSKNSFLYKTNEFIENHPRLKENVSFNPYSDKDISILLSKCRELIDCQSENQKKAYNDMLFSMVINFVYCFGTKYSLLRNIKINDLNFKYNYIYINGIKVHLNEKILDDLEKYINVRDNIKSDSDYLFLSLDGNQIDLKTGFFAERLEQIIERNDFSGLIQHSIVNMIRQNIDTQVISKITGNKLSDASLIVKSFEAIYNYDDAISIKIQSSQKI